MDRDRVALHEVSFGEHFFRVRVVIGQLVDGLVIAKLDRHSQRVTFHVPRSILEREAMVRYRRSHCWLQSAASQMSQPRFEHIGIVGLVVHDQVVVEKYGLIGAIDEQYEQDGEEHLIGWHAKESHETKRGQERHKILNKLGDGQVERAVNQRKAQVVKALLFQAFESIHEASLL